MANSVLPVRLLQFVATYKNRICVQTNNVLTKIEQWCIICEISEAFYGL